MRNARVPDPHQTWTESEARAVFAAWRRSGESLSAFARRHGVDVQRLYWWRRRLGAAATTEDRTTLSLVPATVIEVGSAAAAITIRLPNGIAIESANASPGWIAAIITELARLIP